MTWMMAGLVCVLLLSTGAVYGLLIGNVAKRHSWSGRKTKNVGGLPPMVLGLLLQIASFILHWAHQGQPKPAWSEFPWYIAIFAGLLAMFVASHVAYPGVPLRDLDKDNLSIR